MDWSVLLSALAIALAGFALWRAYEPPQRRDVARLSQLCAELVEDVDGIHARLTTRAKRENVETAREVKAIKATLREQAEAVLAAKAEGMLPSPQAALPLPTGSDEATLAALRRRAGIH